MRTATTIVLLFVLLIVVALIASGVGPYPIAPLAVLDVLTHRLFGTTADTTLSTVLFNIRLPRVIAAGLVGAALAAAGAAYQSLFRNPLVSPDILGVSTGAGLGAVIGILLGFPVVMIQLFGFAGGLATVMIVVTLARTLRGSGDVLVLVLAGIVVGALAGAAISLVKVLADPYDQLAAITFWLLGSLAGVKANDVAATVPVVLIGLAPLILLRWRIGVLSLGDDEARALAQKANVIMMDEPTASLDLGNRGLVLDTIRSLSESGLTIVLSTHEPEHAFIVADQVAILGRDRFVTGAPATTMTSNELSRLYGLPITIEQTASGRSVVVPGKKDG